jgi:predicted ester cyclase
MATDIASQMRQGIDEIWDKGNLRIIDEECSPDFVLHDVVSGHVDREGFKQHVRTFRGAFPDLHCRLDDVIVSGDFVTIRWICEGTHRGDLLGMAPTGRSISTTGLMLIRLAGEKLREMWSHWDVLGLMRQLGAAPLMGESAGVQPSTEAARPSPEARH